MEKKQVTDSVDIGMTLKTKAKWVAGLSDGTTVVEGKGIAEEVKGELSPWLKLQEHLKKTGLKINSLNIRVGDKHYNLPSVKPKFEGEVPKGFNYFRRVSYDILTDEGKNVEHYICVEAIYDGYKAQLYVDENDTNKMWTNIQNDKEEVKK